MLGRQLLVSYLHISKWYEPFKLRSLLKFVHSFFFHKISVILGKKKIISIFCFVGHFFLKTWFSHLLSFIFGPSTSIQYRVIVIVFCKFLCSIQYSGTFLGCTPVVGFMVLYGLMKEKKKNLLNIYIFFVVHRHFTIPVL